MNIPLYMQYTMPLHWMNDNQNLIHSKKMNKLQRINNDAQYEIKLN